MATSISRQSDGCRSEVSVRRKSREKQKRRMAWKLAVLFATNNGGQLGAIVQDCSKLWTNTYLCAADSSWDTTRANWQYSSNKYSSGESGSEPLERSTFVGWDGAAGETSSKCSRNRPGALFLVEVAGMAAYGRSRGNGSGRGGTSTSATLCWSSGLAVTCQQPVPGRG
jgi:hypothetical protein